MVDCHSPLNELGLKKLHFLVTNYNSDKSITLKKKFKFISMNTVKGILL
jgi:hypothetical protein